MKNKLSFWQSIVVMAITKNEKIYCQAEKVFEKKINKAFAVVLCFAGGVFFLSAFRLINIPDTIIRIVVGSIAMYGSWIIFRENNESPY